MAQGLRSSSEKLESGDITGASDVLSGVMMKAQVASDEAGQVGFALVR